MLRPGDLEGEVTLMIPNPEYAAEFEGVAVLRVEAGQSVGVVVRD